MSSAAFLPSASDDAWRGRALSEPGRVGCLFCDFSFEGPMRDAIEASAAHRAEEHGRSALPGVLEDRAERDAWAAAAYASGLGLVAVAERMGVTIMTARKSVVRGGGAIRPRGRRKAA